MPRIAPLLALALLLGATAAVPAAAAQLPPNPFDQFACASPGGTGLVGYARAMVWLACFAVLFTGSSTYELACFVSGAC